MTDRLILVRHSMPEIVAGTPPNRWRLSEDGRARCNPLVERLREHDLAVIVSSTELKAIETGQIVARLLGKPFETGPDLHEHERSNVAFSGRAAFQSAVATLFERPQALVMGTETADQAYERFSGGVERVLKECAPGNTAIVTHGTVIALFAARIAGLEPFPFWQRLGLPAYVVFRYPALELQEVVERV